MTPKTDIFMTKKQNKKKQESRQYCQKRKHLSLSKNLTFTIMCLKLPISVETEIEIVHLSLSMGLRTFVNLSPGLYRGRGG